MRSKQPDIRLYVEETTEIDRIRGQVGQTVPLSSRYTQGQRATLVSIQGDTATLLFPNGARLENVPLKDLVDDSGYWKR